MLLDVVEPQEPARGGHVQRPVPHRDAVGLIEPTGDQHDPVRLVVTVAVHDRMHLASGPRSHEHGPAWSEDHLAGVLHLVGEHVGLKSRRKHQ